ncbi:MAG: hypothetical protein JXJ22_16040 [Bacteroidales bacterium]|nr:hypothetical protein [Bacteroidales bacterium]
MNTITVGLHVVLLKEGDTFVAYCPALELSSYGGSEEKAKQRFEEEIKIFFDETAKKGTLEKYLLKQGWTLTKKPVPKYNPPEEIDIPYTNRLGSFTENIAIPV